MSNIPCEMLLHPELLSNDQLLSVIRERHLKISTLDQMSRELLLDLFHNYCVPYAQRNKDMGRGKVLKRTGKLEHSRSPIMAKVDIVYSHQNSIIRVNNDGITPPPDLLSGHMKRIKLSNDIIKKSLPSISEVSTNKRAVTEMEVTSDIPPSKKPKIPITWP